MTHTTNMYGSNLKEYAQHVLDNKQIAVSTRAEWNMLIKRLPLEEFTYPPVEMICTTWWIRSTQTLELIDFPSASSLPLNAICPISEAVGRW